MRLVHSVCGATEASQKNTETEKKRGGEGERASGMHDTQ